MSEYTPIIDKDQEKHERESGWLSESKGRGFLVSLSLISILTIGLRMNAAKFAQKGGVDGVVSQGALIRSLVYFIFARKSVSHFFFSGI